MKTTTPKTRNPVQITVVPAASNNIDNHTVTLFALCNDGTIWRASHASGDPRKIHWKQLPSIPLID